MTSVVCYVNIRVRRGKFQVFRDWWIDCQHGPWKRLVHGPCWQKALHDNLLFSASVWRMAL